MKGRVTLFSRKWQYALRAVFEMATRSGEGPKLRALRVPRALSELDPGVPGFSVTPKAMEDTFGAPKTKR